MDFISNNFKEIILAIIALFAVGIIIKVSIKKGSSNRVIQKKNKVKGGDIVGRDKKKN